MLKKMATTRKRGKPASGAKPRRVRRHARARAKGSAPPMNYLLEEHPEL
jgi:hypothetical protein